MYSYVSLSTLTKGWGFKVIKIYFLNLAVKFYKPRFPGQTIYGRVLWNPDQDLKGAYRLYLDKVYLCTGRDGYVPTFDPTGDTYGGEAEYGCIEPSKKLKHRFLLLVS